jgi:hypothetical protein
METVWHKGTIKVYPVTDSKLDELTAGYNSLHLVFLGIFAGGTISSGIALGTGTDVSQKPYYLAAFLTSLGLSILFGIIGVGNYRRASRAKTKLYQESVPLEVKSPEISN